MSPKAHLPIRMCIGCGSRRAKRELIRFDRDGARVPPEGARDIRGRSFYLCADPVCLAAARRKMKRRGLLEGLGGEGLELRRVQGKQKQEERE